MKPGQRLLSLVSGVMITLAVLTACRKEVPPPPTPAPVPEQNPKPRVQVTAYAAWGHGLPSAG